MPTNYNVNVVANEQIAEYGKFVRLDNQTRFPAVSVIRLSYPDKSEAFPGNINAPALTSIDVYPKFGVISYIANTDDFAVSLSAGQINLDTTQIEAHLSNIDIETTIMANALTATEWNTFDTASGVNELNYNFLNAVSALSTTVINPIVTVTQPTQLDAFGRLRTSSPLTLFDSSHRYRDNGLWASLTAVGGAYSFNANQGLVDLTVNNLSGSSVVRETIKTFSYQPGKSLLALNTFVMASSSTNLRQRVGYYGASNGIYFQLDGDTISFVQRSSVTGSLVETIVPRSSWSGDKLDGTGPSKLNLDITKAQIFWTDIEWLGVGTVRVGFVINGQYIICHSFQHANINATTYITTASLPLRYEIYNKGATSGSNTLKQICSSVISEGGYELRGLQQAVGTPITLPYNLVTAGVNYPLVSLRLKSTRLDAIVILTALSFIGKSNAYYNWRVIAGGTTTGGGWSDAGVDSSVEYNLSATAITGGRTLASGYTTTSTQGSTQVDILKEALFTFQLERDSLNNTAYELTLVATADTATSNCYGSADWEEISR